MSLNDVILHLNWFPIMSDKKVNSLITKIGIDLVQTGSHDHVLGITTGDHVVIK